MIRFPAPCACHANERGRRIPSQFYIIYTRSMTDFPPFPLRHLTEAELATIGKVVLLWGMHEQNVGTIVSVAYKIPNNASADLVFTLWATRERSILRLRPLRRSARKTSAQNFNTSSVSSGLNETRWLTVHSVCGRMRHGCGPYQNLGSSSRTTSAIFTRELTTLRPCPTKP